MDELMKDITGPAVSLMKTSGGKYSQKGLVCSEVLEE